MLSLEGQREERVGAAVLLLLQSLAALAHLVGVLCELPVDVVRVELREGPAGKVSSCSTPKN